jgi:predicted RNA methylase
MKLDHETLNEIAALDVKGAHVKIVRPLPRPLYVKVDTVLQACGGKWVRGAKSHVFDRDPTDLLDKVVLTGEVTTHADLGFFPTPPALAERVIETAGIEEGMAVLEPSAGDGALALPAFRRGAEVTCVELEPGRCDALTDALRKADAREGGGLYEVIQGDFLSDLTLVAGPRFDRVVMNPPFARQADIDHVLRAFECLKPGGRLVAIMSASVAFRTNRKTSEFRSLVEEQGGTIEELPEGSFKDAGTAVNTVLVVIDR